MKNTMVQDVGKERIINVHGKSVNIPNTMEYYLSIAQMKKQQEILQEEFVDNELQKKDVPNEDFLQFSLDAKRIERCSERTIRYYCVTITYMLLRVTTLVREITTDEAHSYLVVIRKRTMLSPHTKIYCISSFSL